MSVQKRIIIFGAGLIGKAALDFYGADRVYCFADNFKAGQSFCGKDVIGFDELLRVHHEFDVVIAMNYEIAELVEKQCQSQEVPVVLWLETVSYLDFESRPDIAQFKDRHKGKRCFLIGNGPSLRSEDLDRLHNNGEITFGCNEIRKIYKYTPWRPTYYFAADLIYVNNHLEAINDTKASVKFIPVVEKFFFNDISAIKSTLTDDTCEICFMNTISTARFSQKIQFSEDPSRGLCAGSSIMYYMLQMSAYMGFKEIYLLGVDNTPFDTEGQNHFYKEEQIESVGIKISTISPEKSKIINLKSYQTAEQYSRVRGFRIYNATRGGCLETFERIDFDNLFKI